MARKAKAKILRAQLNATETSPTGSLINKAQDYFEVNEAAQIMRISTRTLYRLIASKKLKKKKLLSRTVILKDDIKIFFAQQYSISSSLSKALNSSFLISAKDFLPRLS